MITRLQIFMRHNIQRISATLYVITRACKKLLVNPTTGLAVLFMN